MLWMVAEPRERYRERYRSELSPQNGSQRFIKAQDNEQGFLHPTIGFSEELKFHDQQHLFIRVSLVTVLNDSMPYQCIHPYRIDSEDQNVQKAAEENALFFPLLPEDLQAGRKSFQIIHYKLTQNELKSIQSLRILNSDEKVLLDEKICSEPKSLIDFCKLHNSQLVFTLTQLCPVTRKMIVRTKQQVFSRIMTGAAILSKDLSKTFIYEPQQGSWHGGDRMLLFVDSLSKQKNAVKKKEMQVIFYFEQIQLSQIVLPKFIDRKTIVLLTPPCPILMEEVSENIEAQICVQIGRRKLAHGSFVYRKESYSEYLVNLQQFLNAKSSKTEEDQKETTQNSLDSISVRSAIKIQSLNKNNSLLAMSDYQHASSHFDLLPELFEGTNDRQHALGIS